ncbi:hypothetical protein C5C53_03895 [Rathayibacter sp. AY1E3]|nr:hypothetical protein C5C53_03895 [Rathayibacter sp. AY1E3]
MQTRFDRSENASENHFSHNDAALHYVKTRRTRYCDQPAFEQFSNISIDQGKPSPPKSLVDRHERSGPDLGHSLALIAVADELIVLA